MDDIVITARERDLGSFTVRRILPYASHRMVGPFIFFDHMGPATFEEDHGVDVRPHPHINLATVTYLFEGKILHRDSLGSVQIIEPGAINWMIAGHGIVHSERTPAELRDTGSQLNGIQCWVALPEDKEEMPPAFIHYPAESLPFFTLNGVELTLLLGNAFNHESPVAVQSDIFYISAKFKKGMKLTLPLEAREGAAYIVTGKMIINAQTIDHCAMLVADVNELNMEALQDTHVMLIGGASVGERFIYWNFVASSEEKIAQAKLDWANGPGEKGSRFPRIPGDDKEFIPLPEEINPKGTIM